MKIITRICPTFMDLLRHLYDNEYYKTLSINEYDSITYHRLNGKIYIVTNLRSGFNLDVLGYKNFKPCGIVINNNLFFEFNMTHHMRTTT